MTIFLTSDHHFKHRNIPTLTGRPFTSVEEMDEQLILRWNSVVNDKNDLVLYVGDFMLGNVKRDLAGILAQLNGRKHLIAGNHDLCFPSHGKPQKYINIYKEAGFSCIDTEPIVFNTRGIRFNISHFPYRSAEGSDHTETERYSEYRLEDDGSWLLCGHVHEKWKTNGKMINVGVDQWDFYPVDIDVLVQMAKDNPEGFPTA